MPVSQECLETRPKQSKHMCEFLTIFTRLEQTAKGGELWIACEGTGVSTGGRAHSSLFFCSADQGVQHVWKCFVRMLGYILVKQPTVILTAPAP